MEDVKARLPVYIPVRQSFDSYERRVEHDKASVDLINASESQWRQAAKDSYERIVKNHPHPQMPMSARKLPHDKSRP